MDHLYEFELFCGLNPDEIDRILSISQEEKYKNEVIIAEDSPQDNDLFVLLGG